MLLAGPTHLIYGRAGDVFSITDAIAHARAAALFSHSSIVLSTPPNSTSMALSEYF